MQNRNGHPALAVIQGMEQDDIEFKNIPMFHKHPRIIKSTLHLFALIKAKLQNL